MDSTVRNTQSVQLSKGLSRYKTVFADVDFDTSFDWRTETFIIQISSDNLSKSDMEVTDELTSAILPSFMALCHDIDKNSQSIQTACKVSGGYSVDCSIECIGTDGELLYSSLNGEEKTSCIDIAATEDKLYGPSYQKMVDAVDAKEYAKCYETWDVLNADGYYDLSYPCIVPDREMGVGFRGTLDGQRGSCKFIFKKALVEQVEQLIEIASDPVVGSQLLHKKSSL